MKPKESPSEWQQQSLLNEWLPESWQPHLHNAFDNLSNLLSGVINGWYASEAFLRQLWHQYDTEKKEHAPFICYYDPNDVLFFSRSPTTRWIMYGMAGLAAGPLALFTMYVLFTLMIATCVASVIWIGFVAMAVTIGLTILVPVLITATFVSAFGVLCYQLYQLFIAKFLLHLSGYKDQLHNAPD